MKINSLFDNKPLGEPLKAHEFQYKSKFTSPTSLMLKVEEAFPDQPPMPGVHPDLIKDPTAKISRSFQADLTVLDQEYMKNAYVKAQEINEQKRILSRANEIERAEAKANGDLSDSESILQQVRLTQALFERLRMSKLFSELKIKSSDEFKLMMHRIKMDDIEQARLMKMLFVRQGGKSAGGAPTPDEISLEKIMEQQFAAAKGLLSHSSQAMLKELNQKITLQNAISNLFQNNHTIKKLN